MNLGKLEEKTMESPWTVSELWKYPIKSCKGTQVSEVTVGTHGISYDREFMIVDKTTGMFVAQRSSGGMGIEIKSLCHIKPEIMGGGNKRMEVSAPGMHPITVYPELFTGMLKSKRREVQVWKATCDAMIADQETNSWFTEFLSRERPGEYQLVKFPSWGIRRAKVGYSQLRYADGYPFLIISEASLDDLNERIGSNVLPMNRFRPNIVISGCKPYEEDLMDRIGIGGIDLEGKELCVRCPITTTNQETGERGKEPLATLATYRRNPIVDKAGVVFGRNFNHLSTGTIKVGDPIELIRYKQKYYQL